MTVTPIIPILETPIARLKIPDCSFNTGNGSPIFQKRYRNTKEKNPESPTALLKVQKLRNSRKERQKGKTKISRDSIKESDTCQFNNLLLEQSY